MKKGLSLFLLVTLVFTLCACDVSIEIKDKDPDDEGGKTELSAGELFDKKLEELELTLESAEIVGDKSLLAPAQDVQTGLWGYVSLSGQWVIEPQFPAAEEFQGDYAFVSDEYSEFDIIDRNGNILFTQYGKKGLATPGKFSEDYFVLTVDSTDEQNKIYLGSDFKSTITPSCLRKEKKPRSYGSSVFFAVATPFYCGRAIVMMQRNIGIKDEFGPETAYIIDPEGEVIGVLPEGLDPADDYGFDNNGCVIVRNSEGLMGLCDYDGNLVIDCSYKRIIHCENKLYQVCNNTGFWGYITVDGDKIADCIYQRAYPFSCGLAAVYDGEHWGFINESGEEVIDFIFDDVSCLNVDDSVSITNKSVFADGRASVRRGDKWVLIDTKGEPVTYASAYNPGDKTGAENGESVEFCESPFKCAEGGYIAVRGGTQAMRTVSDSVEALNYYGLIDTDGRLYFLASFADLGYFQ